MFLLWNYFAQHILGRSRMWIHILPKLCIELIKVTPYSIMNVKLATQALRSTVS